MANWRERKALYEIHESSRKNTEVYVLSMTGAEIADWCRVKNENYGYVAGVGGDKHYSCWAVELTY